ncbi:Heavy metal-associated isoprenylated plant protein 4 [Cardamine amara subsp. amara]|uniref:Heavy metal-associated isoprenylated plant protein 4 n=1 Tax=Cardamine amara subsp. amara TaxID=228776 RepID=A0ABD1ACR6_CARAN
MGEKEEKKEKGEEIITAVYKVHLHCRKCACDIKKPLLRFQGVHSVDVDVEKNEIKVKGKIEVVKIHKQIEKWSKKKVELISPKPSEVKKTTTTTTTTSVVVEKKTTEVKKDVIRTTVLKVHIHCAQCDKDLQNKLLRNKAIHIVKTDRKAQTLTVQGTIESAKLLTYIKKKVHKHAEIISSKTEEEKKKEEEEKKKKEEEKKKEDEKKKKEDEKKKKEEVKVEVTKTITQVVEFKEKVKVEGQKDKDGNIPYFVHYVYAPQLFSDENPNACCIV